MKSIPLDNPHARLGAPPNWNHETDGICHTLDIWLLDGAMVSGWLPSASDLVKLNAGEPLFLHISAAQHPVVGFSVGYARPTAPAPTKCSLCGEDQFSTPHGDTCANGHGGAPAA